VWAVTVQDSAATGATRSPALCKASKPVKLTTFHAGNRFSHVFPVTGLQQGKEPVYLQALSKTVYHYQA
jgi:hypothetical protein